MRYSRLASDKQLVLAGGILLVRRKSQIAVGGAQGSSLSDANFILGRAEDSTRRGLLFEHLLLMRVGVADLNEMFLAARLGNRRVVKLADDLLADFASFEPDKVSDNEVTCMCSLPSEANTTTTASRVTKNLAGADLVRSKDGT